MIGLLGPRGITVLEPSADIGVGSACMSNHGSNTTEFEPMLSGTSPYILSVCATQAVSPEVAWNDGSGGF
jgi:tripeptidyl-peptidase-1